MLDTEQQRILNDLLGRLNRDQILWLSGYLKGLAGGTEEDAPAANRPQIDVYYATETGNTKTLSLQVMKALKNAGFKTKSAAVNRLKPEDIAKSEHAIFLVSTHGEGDPPEAAAAFFELMQNAPEGALGDLSYAVLGLGDKSYEIFCGAALTLEEQIQRLGGKPFQSTALFDVDYASHTPKWIAETVKTLNEKVGGDAHAPATVSAGLSFDSEPEVRTGKGYTRLEPITGTIKDIVNLNDIGSDKETYHIEISYTDDIVYTPGDAAGIILPLDADGKEQTPRLYSIASAPSVHTGELHLTVALATYIREDGSTGYGVASKFLADKKAGDCVEFYISQNQIFNLPSDNQDAIMIGPGTGIAPFRSFVYERSERGADGRNWVIFGDRRAHCDFLYQAEWQEHLALGNIDRLDLAFSRDRDHKVYVQDRLREQADRLIEWLDNGATIYVCGAKDPMSRDVERTLVEILTSKKSLSEEQAADYLADLEEDGRYLKDVY